MASFWNVLFHDDLAEEFDGFEEDVQDGILVLAGVLKEFGPNLKRPYADTLKGSKHGNMKELRFSAADGEWRVAYAFDPERAAILLVAGDKSGGGQKRFYKTLIATDDRRFDAHLATLEQSGNRREARHGKKP